MYSEDFDEASVDFQEEVVASSPAAAEQQAAPLGDAELDAYLAADEPAQQGPAVQQAEPKSAEQSADQQLQQLSIGSGVAGTEQQQLEPAADTGRQLEEDSLAGDESRVEPYSSHKEELDVDQLQELEEPLPAAAHVQQQHYAAVVLTAQPAQHAAHATTSAGSSARSSAADTAAAAASSSRRASTASHSAAAVTAQAAAEVPADPRADSDDECAGISTQSAFSIHAGTGSISSLGGGPVQHRVKPRPASASPAVRCSSSARDWDSAQEQQYQYSPSSSSPPYRQQQQQELEVLPVASWTVNDVCDWVDGLGLSQYRKKFMHHVVHGNLLLRLNDELLRKELAIGPLGHRVLILDGIQAVAAADLQQAASAALAGTSPEDYQASCACSNASGAAAVLVAGLIALKAASQRGGSGCNSPHLLRSSSGSPVNTAAAAGSPGARRARPYSAPCRGKGRERSASPVGGRGSPSPGALGPAAGRISVYEQRAKLLFELGRAQARAAATAGTANEVSGRAQIAQKEVAMLQGQLADLDKKNKLAVQHGSGSVDSRGIIPWQHVGGGTKAADPFPERLARPWDSPEVELTFKPRISAKSKQLMAEARGLNEGGGGFLDRLDNDLRRREAKQKELEKRYYSNDAADAAKATKQAIADFNTLSAYFSQRGWTNLSLSSSSSESGRKLKQLTEADYRELDGQIDEIVDSYSEELGLGKSDSKQSHAIVSAHGAKKLAALVAAVRTVQFMDRYHADLNTRGSRLQQLQDSFFKQQAVSPGPGRAPVMPLTTDQKDMVQAVKWFQGMGWEVDELDDCDDLLSALVTRARHYKTEAEKLHEKERAAAGATGPHSAILPHPNINWSAAPWSVDGLGKLMQTVLDARKAAADEAAAQQAANSKPSAVDAALQQAGQQAGQQATSAQGAAGGADASSGVQSTTTYKTLEAAAASGADTLDLSVRLLAGMRWAGLDQLDAASGKTKKLAVYRALRTQQFLAFTAADLEARELKQKALLAEFEASRRGKLVSKAELDDFYQRLAADGERRRAELDKARADKAEREAKALALVSVGPGFSRRPRSAK